MSTVKPHTSTRQHKVVFILRCLFLLPFLFPPAFCKYVCMNVCSFAEPLKSILQISCHPTFQCFGAYASPPTTIAQPQINKKSLVISNTHSDYSVVPQMFYVAIFLNCNLKSLLFSNKFLKYFFFCNILFEETTPIILEKVPDSGFVQLIPHGII